MVYSKVLACLHVGSPSLPHDLITFIYRVVLPIFCSWHILFFVLFLFIFYFILFYFILYFFSFYYPLHISYLPCWTEYCKVRRSGRTAYMFPAKVFVCVMCEFLCVYVCVCVCVSVVYCHSFFFYV